MTDRTKKLLLAVVPCRLVSPSGFVWAAVALCLFYAVCHALGWREYTAFLSGSAPTGEQAASGFVLGIVYFVAYVGFVLVAPILVVASGLFTLLLRACRST